MPAFASLVPDSDYHQNRYAATLWRALPDNGTWVDLGAGRRLHGGWVGPSCDELRRKAGAVVGVDVVAPHLRAHPHLTGAAVGWGEALPIRTASADLVSANMVLEHLADPLGVFREVARILKPGGAFVFVTPNRAHPVIRAVALLLHPKVRTALAWLLERREAAHIFHTHYRANRLLDLLRLAWEAGLNVERLTPFASFPMFRRVPPLLALEAAWIRWGAADGGSNLVGVLRRPVPSAAERQPQAHGAGLLRAV